MRLRLTPLLVILVLLLCLLAGEAVFLGQREVFNPVTVPILALLVGVPLVLALLTVVTDWPALLKVMPFLKFYERWLEPDAPELLSKGELPRLIRLKRALALLRSAGRVRDSAAKTPLPNLPPTPGSLEASSGAPAVESSLDRLLRLKHQTVGQGANREEQS